MGSRILLFSVNQYDFPYPVYPLGAAQVEAALRRAGHTTFFVDYNVNRQPVRKLLAEFNPDFVGVSLRNIDDILVGKRETFFESLINLVKELRANTRVPIVLGGSGYSIFPEELLEHSGADFGIQGEGESQLLALIDALKTGGDYTKVSGLVYQQNGKPRMNARTRMEPALEIPTPERSEPLSRHYLQKSSMLNIQTQRGCALTCCYCTYPLLEGRNYRRRSAEAVADELTIMERHGARYVFVVDSVFNTSPSHVTAICEAILERGLKLKWCCFLRPKNLTRELMQLMGQAGLTHIEFGADSFSDSVLNAYGKQLTFDDILESSQHAAAANIDYAHFLILGGPGETTKTLEETFTNSMRLPGAIIMARVGMRVYPGTPLFKQLQTQSGATQLPPLLKPLYHVAPELTEDQVFTRLREVGSTMPNWIYEDPPPAYYKMADRLRAKGVIGPLWSYIAMMQRMEGLASSDAAGGS